jgi:hypothetical protein
LRDRPWRSLLVSVGTTFHTDNNEKIFAEVYNAVLRGARAQPLVGIIEFFLYRTMKYFLERANAAHAAMQDLQKVYST